MIGVLAQKIRTSRFDWFKHQYLDLVTLMSALLFLDRSPYTNDEVKLLLFVSAVLIPGLRRFGPFWIGVGIFRFFSQVPENWPGLDNHQHLINWWYIGLGLTLMSSKKDEAIRILSRLLIGLCFLFAMIWKIRSPDFLSGDFFSWRLVTDSRFEKFAEAFLGLESESRLSRQEVLSTLRGGEVGSFLTLETGPRVRPAAIAITWYTVFIESAVAVCYLLPQRFRLSQWAHWVLLTFIVTVYPMAPVVGFALILLTMSVGASPATRFWPIVAISVFIIAPLFKRFDDLFTLFN